MPRNDRPVHAPRATKSGALGAGKAQPGVRPPRPVLRQDARCGRLPAAMPRSCVTMTIVRLFWAFKVRRIRRISSAGGVVEVSGRLVGQEDLRLDDQRPGNGHALHFAPRQLSRPLCFKRWSKPDESQQFAWHAAHARCASAGIANIAWPIIYGASTFSSVVSSGQQVIELKNHAESAGCARRRGGGPGDCRCGRRRSGFLRRPDRRACRSKCSSVLLPDPLWPMIDRNSPCRTSRIDVRAARESRPAPCDSFYAS